MPRKGIILAGGSGTRLYPLTNVISKQLLLVYDKPMIYYPLSVLMMAGIQEILIITIPQDQDRFQALLGDGSQWGLRFSYLAQPSPDGIAQAFLLGEDFLAGDPSALVLGDNIFFGNHLYATLQSATHSAVGATIFSYHVNDPQRYGIVTFDDQNRAISIEEKPQQPQSHYAVTGLYFYDHRVVEYAKQLTPSNRGELEITDINRCYLNDGLLHVQPMHRGYAWLDAGTPSSMHEASSLIATLQHRQGLMVACIEEIAYRMNYISVNQLQALAKPLMNSVYGQYIHRLALANLPSSQVVSASTGFQDGN